MITTRAREQDDVVEGQIHAQQRIDARAAGQPEIEQHELQVLEASRARQRTRKVAFGVDARVRDHRAHHRGKRLMDHRMIVDQQHVHRKIVRRAGRPMRPMTQVYMSKIAQPTRQEEHDLRHERQ